MDGTPEVQEPSDPLAHIATQLETDHQLLSQNLAATRMEFAGAKLKMQMARLGLKGLGLGHPREHNEAVISGRKIIAELERLIVAGEGIPDHATELEVATLADVGPLTDPTDPPPDAAA